jgi:hypothetical protein
VTDPGPLGAPGLVPMWLALHDIRGGSNFAALDLDVTP